MSYVRDFLRPPANGFSTCNGFFEIDIFVSRENESYVNCQMFETLDIYIGIQWIHLLL